MAESWDPDAAQEPTRLTEVDPMLASGCRNLYDTYVGLRMAKFNQTEACTIIGVMIATGGNQNGDVGD